MINYGRVKSKKSPPNIEITPDYVYAALNIQTLEEEVDGVTETIYTYDYVSYTKDEYISTITAENARAIDELNDELAATKILLGVD